MLDGTGRRHAEYPIHTEVLAARDDVNCVVHTHAPYAVAFGATGEPLRPVSHEATLFAPPDICRFTETGDLILTPELGKRVAASLEDRNALLLVHHGVVVADPDVAKTTVATILLDRACRMQLQVMAATREYHWTPDEEALTKRDHCYPGPLLDQAWNYLARVEGEAG